MPKKLTTDCPDNTDKGINLRIATKGTLLRQACEGQAEANPPDIFLSGTIQTK